ncbi:hypothetical protein GCK72_022571 [Caenorhabditis remanei]|uniref:Uncharacterized protein n=1 Tax=Caenorhabditis remanei TaxID=31234 RepID=A0A6A5FUG4_CAERE|nr:hypothetical protein GCK72_022571 [Caenorhabditis remanei]KAF1746119.1 hypothetical protein GCK72_022571 [Caenorhabditis remanei]
MESSGIWRCAFTPPHNMEHHYPIQEEPMTNSHCYEPPSSPPTPNQPFQPIPQQNFVAMQPRDGHNYKEQGGGDAGGGDRNYDCPNSVYRVIHQQEGLFEVIGGLSEDGLIVKEWMSDGFGPPHREGYVPTEEEEERVSVASRNSPQFHIINELGHRMMVSQQHHGIHVQSVSSTRVFNKIPQQRLSGATRGFHQYIVSPLSPGGFGASVSRQMPAQGAPQEVGGPGIVVSSQLGLARPEVCPVYVTRAVTDNLGRKLIHRASDAASTTRTTRTDSSCTR